VDAVIETHNHADHVSDTAPGQSHRGAYLCARAGGVTYPHHNLTDGTELTFGWLKCVLYTPGHRPEHIALTVQILAER